MPIQSKHKQDDSERISVEGEFVVKVTKVELTKSKKGDDMCVIQYTTHDGRSIKGHYVQKYKFMIDALTDAKIAAGLEKEAKASQLLGLELGIKVEQGKPNDEGHSFMQITGYDKKSEVTGFVDSGITDSEVPF